MELAKRAKWSLPGLEAVLFSDVDFSYQVTGVRDGFENLDVIVDVDKINEPGNVSQKRAAYNKKVKTLAKKMNNVKKCKVN